MKTLFITLAMAIGFTTLAQDNNIITTTLHVEGLCGMCEERIENAAYIKGVKEADWDVESHILTITYDKRKTSIEKIIAAINEVGHDVEGHPATDEQYNGIHGCCRYRDPDQREAHGLDPEYECKAEENAEDHSGHNHG